MMSMLLRAETKFKFNWNSSFNYFNNANYCVHQCPIDRKHTTGNGGVRVSYLITKVIQLKNEVIIEVWMNITIYYSTLYSVFCYINLETDLIYLYWIFINPGDFTCIKAFLSCSKEKALFIKARAIFFF